MVAIWFPEYLPVIVPFSLISIFTELSVISSMRLSVTLDLIVRLLRKILDDLLAMSLFIKVQMSINVADRCYNMDRLEITEERNFM